jgi:hypothetical protein
MAQMALLPSKRYEILMLHPAVDGQRGFEIELIGEIAAMVDGYPSSPW